MINEPRAIWGSDGWASSSGWAFAHCVNTETGEYITSKDVWVSVGTSLPAGAYLDAPPSPQDGKAIVRNNDLWTYVDDFRGKTAYKKDTAQSIIISNLGPIPDNLTLIARNSVFDYWSENTGSWVKDLEAERFFLIQQAQTMRSSLMQEASQEISVLVDALDPSITAFPDKSDQDKLNLWRSYRVDLSKVEQQPEYPFSISWPQKPN